MELPRSRWFEIVDGKTTFRFGQYKGEALEDVLQQKRGVNYLEHMLKFEDMTVPIARFIEHAIETGDDPAVTDRFLRAVRAEEDLAKSLAVDSKLDNLKARAKIRAAELALKKKAEVEEKLLKARKEQSEW